mgnify:CR=1 FL=1
MLTPIKRRSCAPPVEVVAGAVFLFLRSILLVGGDPPFPGWGVVRLVWVIVLFFLYFVDEASDNKHVCRQWSPVGAGLMQADKGLGQCSDAARSE